MMYGVCTMPRQRTNIYLDDHQLAVLRALAEARGESVAALVRTAVNEWIRGHGVRHVDEDEWTRRFDEFLERGRKRAQQEGWTEEEVERDVMEAIREVRRARAARRR
jgi:hypothetical protein